MHLPPHTPKAADSAATPKPFFNEADHASNSRTEHPCSNNCACPAFLTSYEARNREAIDRKLAYTDFLSLLIHDEVARREQKKLDMRLRRASFRNQKTLEGFDFDRLPNLKPHGSP